MISSQTPVGFQFSGIFAGVKVSRKDLALIASDRDAVAVAVTTQNQLRAACAERVSALLPATNIRAIVVASGNANCLSGEREVADDQAMATVIAGEMNIDSQQVLTATTGSIGKPLNINAIVAAAPKLVNALTSTPDEAARAMLTTDRTVKIVYRALDYDGQTVRICGIAKGAGMIHPNMATMLGYLTTDAAVDPQFLASTLKAAVSTSFNQITVDRDTSTNDMVVLLANGASGVTLPDGDPAFTTAIAEICYELSMMIAADGEGATRLITINVQGARTDELARALARSVVEGNLFKAAVYGGSSGWGRLLAAVGARASELGEPLDKQRITLKCQGKTLFDHGNPTGVTVLVSQKSVTYDLDLGSGDGSGRALGCDLSYEYVSINAVTKSDPLKTHSPGLKRRLIVEALCYIKKFSGKLAVIKYGGAAMLRDDLKDAFAEDLVLLKAAGLMPVVVHGGGPEISRTLRLLGEDVKFVDGMRVTDAASMKIVEMVLTGSVNTDVVTRIHKFGGRAIGLSGKDGGLLMARKMKPKGHDLGVVGDVTAVNNDVITMLLEKDYIPVISPVGVDGDGVTYNINADRVAARIAASLGAQKILFLTDVPGILRDGDLISQTTPKECRELIDSGIVNGGMIPKVEALLDAVAAGVNSGHIIDGRVPHNLVAELFTDIGVGTWIIE